MIRIEKQLCAVGREIENQINLLLAQQQVDFRESRRGEIFRELKNYFRHRQACADCQVHIEIVADGNFR